MIKQIKSKLRFIYYKGVYSSQNIYRAFVMSFLIGTPWIVIAGDYSIHKQIKELRQDVAVYRCEPE